MDSSLPPISDDLWPKVSPVIVAPKPGGRVALEIPALTENLLLPVLCRAVHHEMRWAGQWAAGIGVATKREFPSEEALSRHSAENAARLLAIYAALYTAYACQGSLNPTPAELKAAASRSYQIHLRDSLHQKQKDDEASSPSTFTPHPPKSALSPVPATPSNHESPSHI